MKNLHLDLKIALAWFANNQVMIANPGKFQFMLLGKHKSLKFEIKQVKLESVKSVKLVRLTVEHNLTYDTHISNIFKTVSSKINPLLPNVPF